MQKNDEMVCLRMWLLCVLSFNNKANEQMRFASEGAVKIAADVLRINGPINCETVQCAFRRDAALLILDVNEGRVTQEEGEVRWAALCGARETLMDHLMSSPPTVRKTPALRDIRHSYTVVLPYCGRNS